MTGIAKPMPMLPPDGEKIAVFTADNLTVEIEGRTARIAAVDRCVDLDEIVIGTSTDIASARGDDTGGHGAAEAEGIADGNDPVTDLDILLGERDVGKLLAIRVLDLEQREIRLGILADQVGLALAAVVERQFDSRGVVHDMIVGHDKAVFGDNEAGALGAAKRALSARATEGLGRARLTEELLEELVEGMVLGQIAEIRHLALLLFVVAASAVAAAARSVDLHVHADHGGAHLLDDVGERQGRTRHGIDSLTQGLPGLLDARVLGAGARAERIKYGDERGRKGKRAGNRYSGRGKPPAFPA